jgi:hypothetical protein
MNVERAVDAVRGLVRPVALFTIMWGVVGFLAVGKVEEAEALGLLGGPILGFWFAERKRG